MLKYSLRSCKRVLPKLSSVRPQVSVMIATIPVATSLSFGDTVTAFTSLSWALSVYLLFNIVTSFEYSVGRVHVLMVQSSLALTRKEASFLKLKQYQYIFKSERNQMMSEIIRQKLK